MKRTLKFLLILFITCPGVAIAQWTPISKFPQKTDGCFSFTLNGKGYCGGGSSGLYEYDTTTNSWAFKCNNPGNFVRAFASSFVINGKAYVVMGDSAFLGSTLQSELWMYDPVTNGWAKKRDYPGGKHAAGFCFVIDSFAYVGGGNDVPFAAYGDFHKYDPSTDSWTPLPNLPNPGIGGVIFSSGFSINRKGYLALGIYSNGTSSGNATFLWEFDPTSLAWSRKSDFPGAGRESAVCFTLNNEAYIGGGQSSFTKTYRDFYKYNPLTDRWTPLADLPTKCGAWASTFVIGNNAYLMTGANITPSSLTLNDSAFKFALNTSDIRELVYNKDIFSVFPNPCSKYLNITVPINAEETQLTIYDISGKLISKIDKFTDRKVNTSTLSKGLYFIKVNYKGQVYMHEFLKQ